MDLNLILFTIAILLFLSLIKYFYQYYSNIKRYPPGPTPLPVFGNSIPLYRKRKTVNPFLGIHEIGKKYGKIFTLWIGSKPIVIITDLEVGKIAFNKNEFSGRPHTSLDAIVSDGNLKSLIFMDAGPELNVFRKVSSESIRRIISEDRFSSLINQVITEMVTLIKARENNRQFSPKTYISNIFLRILAELSFGQTYSFGDDELDFIANTFELYNNTVAKMVLTDFMPIAKYYYPSTVSNKLEIYKLSALYKEKFRTRRNSYKHGSCDNFCDALITAKLNANLLSERKEFAQFLTDDNLAMDLSALYVSGSDKSIIMFNWILLLMSYYPLMQKRLRSEIKDKIGDKIVDLSDTNNLHYVNAFVCETLRYRNITGIGVPHKTLNDVSLENYLIPKDTMVILYQHSILNDPKYWTKPELFMPERFLDENGFFVSVAKFPAFIPFGIGQRNCVAETMAMNILLLVVVNLLQKTSGYEFVLPNGPQTHDLDYSVEGVLFQPKPYKIVLKKID